jgi:hypothetical protein
LADTVRVSLADADNPGSVYYGIDSVDLNSQPEGDDYTVALDVSKLTTGPHLLTATLRPNDYSTIKIYRTVQVHSREAALDTSVVERPDAVDVDVVATSDSGIVSIDASLDGAPLGSLGVPNACKPDPCPVSQSFNAYRFSIPTRPASPGQHFVKAIATDAAGNTATGFATVTLPVPTAATLDSPADGASVSDTLHLSGSYASGTPGALELLITLGGEVVYDKTVSNPGSAVSFSTDARLPAITPGSHMLCEYARVGNTNYAPMTSRVITVQTVQGGAP